MTDGGPLGVAMDGAGVVLRALGLWLDPLTAVPAAFVSHAHALPSAGERGGVTSAVEGGGVTLAGERGGVRIASAQTLALVAEQAGVPPNLASRTLALSWGVPIEWPIRPEFGGGTAWLKCVPAGHVLGAAQLAISHPRGQLVYTGDWSAEAEGTHPGGTVLEADEVILNAGFGLPIFRFPPLAGEIADVVQWCRDLLAKNVTPCVLAPNPGPAQTLARALWRAGLPTAPTVDVARSNLIYEALEVPMGAALQAGGPQSAAPASRSVVLGSSRLRASDVRTKGRCAVAYASGWALLDAAVEQKRADAAFVVADCADFDGLLAYAETARAGHVYVARGEARTFAHVLRQRGFAATALDGPRIDDRGAF